jgi:glycosyltransferase involved in cell wall biosynthesis
MKVLGLSFVRNAEERLPAALDSMAVYCDQICVVDDRSTDRTGDILRAHPTVSNVFTVDPALSNAPWYIPESTLLAMLYRMADLCQPDWVVLLSADETIVPPENVRALLSDAGPDIAGFHLYLVSAWTDETYPFMVPLMGQARSQVGRIWRYRPGLAPSGKRLHNSYFPVNIKDGGRVEFRGDLVIDHAGWSTLAERVAKVELYTSLDPDLELNSDVPYDIGLLFGFERHRIDDLVQEYERRLETIRRDPRSSTNNSRNPEALLSFDV